MPFDPTPGRRAIVRSRGRPDRIVVVLSDIEMGAGGPFDDFPHSAFCADLLLSYAGPAHADLDVDLVFNGDTFDLLKTSHEGAYPHHITAEVAVAKMARVGAAHPRFFEGIRAFLDRTGRRGRVFFVVGNHDAELVFPEVQDLVATLCGGPAGIHFPGFSVDIGRAHLEHGSQVDPMFRMDEDRLFVDFEGQRILNVSWAAVALLDVLIPLQHLLYHHDRLRPKPLMLKLVPEVKEVLNNAIWQYWTRDYWREYLKGTDPVKGVSWTMLKEVVRRLAYKDPDVSMGDEFQRRIVESDRHDLYLVGHQHDPGWWSFGDRKLLRTGAMRDEYMLSEGGEVQTPINKTYAEVFLAGEQVVRSHLVEVIGPPRSPETMPSSIFAVVPALRALLAEPTTRSQAEAAQRAEEQREQRASR
jgi:UDP-2,3-diacylglucosamine pyrophosphatase LpxH